MRIVLILVVFLLTFLTGCSANENAHEDVPDEYKTRAITVKDSVQEKVDRKTGQQIAKHLVELANRVPDVQNTTAVVLGQYAVVGIDVDQNLDRNKVESIKYSVAEALKHDPYGANAVVVADPDTIKRLQNIAASIQDGRPIGGILDELAAIVGRVMPNIPSDIIDNQEKKPTKQFEDQLPQNKERQLKKEQNDQSNQQMKK
ncbi:YhcN/YlaJ family sporulation lipoprotein [Bacillus alveayuensis]|jgi:YhcN/YlaJ family sporulation lipoprotein|uniref:YhcN/YlaJ family sporulation lipoprotein n=1 Tax=Aeribacillus alveayuensis TaxID=279215 RepID=A0ABT9VPD4_9BACI|nr:YhcN/YlaJ family sporulation lipoprotein [Bacillus alveayuensis]MDQ0162813.1 YhcN/YlaJ family sporulation lipoprotein [Bacillus alveayuensis]